MKNNNDPYCPTNTTPCHDFEPFIPKEDKVYVIDGNTRTFQIYEESPLGVKTLIGDVDCEYPLGALCTAIFGNMFDKTGRKVMLDKIMETKDKARLSFEDGTTWSAELADLS